MLTKSRKPWELPWTEVTQESLYINRRQFLGAGALGLATAVGAAWPAEASAQNPLPPKGKYDTDEKQSPFKDVTSYNNYYEFGIDKDMPVRNAHRLKTSPWMVSVEGQVKKPQKYPIEELIKGLTVEDRIYRMRCVEGWSMVIPWQGFPLGELVKRLEPTSKAKYIEFQTLFAPDQMPGQRQDVLAWPYVEGLRLDEAMNPLTLMVTGLYGKPELPNQNGAPMRLVVPWKYGFKGIKSIVKIRFTEDQPTSSWARSAPHEYGFYANVNPAVDHPRWTQATERRLGEFFRRKTLPFNGYGDHVASLYAGMDLKKFY